ncbi:MAG: sodium ion-translocating decarboxylase subunit beta, partial [Oscillospiraceae bacterium]|nr:sodium ion-translocating decarboxylase subunit beta [Oscillospiraceae bacterium]
MDILINTLVDLSQKSGFAQIFTEGGWKIIVMILISCVLIYLAIAKQFEPLLLLPIAFGMLLTNLPGGGLFHPELFNPKMVDGVVQSIDYGQVLHNGGLLDILYLGVKLGIYPPLIFLGIGAMTDFAPLISNPKSFLLGAAAQAGIFFTFIVAAFLPMYTLAEAGGIAIIGGADGPTSILVASRLAPHLLGSIAIAAYSYMALVPVIQPPIMKALTTKKERSVVMKPLRPVSKTEKILFPIIVTMLVIMLVPDTAPLIG